MVEISDLILSNRLDSATCSSPFWRLPRLLGRPTVANAKTATSLICPLDGVETSAVTWSIETAPPCVRELLKTLRASSLEFISGQLLHVLDKQLHELGSIQRLRGIVIEPGFETTLAIALHGMGGKGDNGDFRI